MQSPVKRWSPLLNEPKWHAFSNFAINQEWKVFPFRCPWHCKTVTLYIYVLSWYFDTFLNIFKYPWTTLNMHFQIFTLTKCAKMTRFFRILRKSSICTTLITTEDQYIPWTYGLGSFRDNNLKILMEWYISGCAITR